MRHGFLLIDKPVGPTSHDIVGMVRKALHEQSVGHLGTLDPGASGLLVLAVGSKALKVVEYFKDLEKEYEAHIRFGSVSSTYDYQGSLEAVERKPGQDIPDISVIQNSLRNHFIGKIRQVPPAFSAVHVNGKRAHELARAGKEVVLNPREVQIHKCDIATYAYPDLHLRVQCSSGTYIRSLAHDLGHMLRTGGYLAGLRRTRVGEWSIEHAVKPSELDWADVLPLKDVLKDWKKIDLTPEEAADVRFGRRIARELSGDTLAWFEGLPIAILYPARDGTRLAQPKKVL